MKNRKNIPGFLNKVYVYIRALLDKRTPAIPKIAGIAIIAYIIFPFDIIPDAIPVFGWLDDAAVTAIGLFIISRMIPAEILAEYAQKAEK